MDISGIRPPYGHTNQTFWIQYVHKHICVLLSLMMQGVNMMSVGLVVYNTGHELISKVNELEL